MATIRIRANEIPRLKSFLKKKSISALNNHKGLQDTLRGQAVRRIKNKGDSTHQYPELWANKIPGHYRSGGNPLQGESTGGLMSSLKARVTTSANKITMRLTDGVGYGVYHQKGFKTKGPNYIPITSRGKKRHQKGNDPTKEGLVKGKDYFIAWNGVTVPQRKIFNLPPEDVQELKRAIGDAIANEIR
jgi:phage gpG-like protein